MVLRHARFALPAFRFGWRQAARRILRSRRRSVAHALLSRSRAIIRGTSLQLLCRNTTPIPTIIGFSRAAQPSGLAALPCTQRAAIRVIPPKLRTRMLADEKCVVHREAI